jgi:hypothetical protein
MRTLRCALLVLASAALWACHVGPRIADLTAPRQPAGAHVVIELDASRHGRSREGELIAVRDDGVIVALPSTGSKQQLTLIDWKAIYRLTARSLPGFGATPAQNGAPSAGDIDKMRLVSRYPQGLSPALTADLLAAYQQQSLDTLAAPPR